jgi:hypothetical protein
MSDEQSDEKQLTPEQLEVLRDAQSRGSLIDGHPDLKNHSPNSPRDTRYQPIQYGPDGGPIGATPEHDPRSFGPVPRKRESGWGGGDGKGTVDDPEWQEKHGYKPKESK